MAFPDPAVENPYTDADGREWVHDGKRWNGGAVHITISGGEGEVATFTDLLNSGTAKTVTLTAAKYQQLTVNANTTITVAGTPVAGEVVECVLRLVHDATTTSRTVAWSGVTAWPNNTVPLFPATENGGRIYVTLLLFPSGVIEGFPGGSFYP